MSKIKQLLANKSGLMNPLWCSLTKLFLTLNIEHFVIFNYILFNILSILYFHRLFGNEVGWNMISNLWPWELIHNIICIDLYFNTYIYAYLILYCLIFGLKWPVNKQTSCAMNICPWILDNVILSCDFLASQNINHSLISISK